VRILVAFLSERPPAATFRMIASPLVSWIWLGAIVTFLGGLLAMWPAPDAARRRATAGLLRGSRRTSAAPDRVEVVAPLLVIVALALVVWTVAAPLRKGPQAVDEAVVYEREGLQAAREAKYNEIRELEMDHRTGKLSDEDFRAPGPPAARRGGPDPALPRPIEP
jgi:hypothetical protein